MPQLVWDQVGDRVYESGLDKGVLYLPDGSAVPWNGLTSIIETFERESTPVYFDGMKISESTTLGDFKATMKAVTYPNEFIELEGYGYERSGVIYADQSPDFFGLCYRTRIGNDIEGDEAGYKIHILYNIMATPSDKTYATTSSEPSLVEFEWTISAVPEEIPGVRPTAHIILNTQEIDPLLLIELEELLYGGTYVQAVLIPMADLISKLKEFFRFEVFDNGDGTWTLTTELDSLVTLDNDGYFSVIGINAWYLDDVTYVFKNTKDIDEVPDIKIHDVGDGTWTAHSQHGSLIEVTASGVAEIHNANINYISEDTYEISNTA